MWVFFLSEKKVEAKDDLRTVECLRGRLLAERQASRLANEEAELIGKKVCSLCCSSSII